MGTTGAAGLAIVRTARLWPNHAKTTIDIADGLLEEAKRTAERERSTLRALEEEGLRAVLARRRRSQIPFRLRDARFKGNGLRPGVDIGTWERIAPRIYEGSGG